MSGTAYEYDNILSIEIDDLVYRKVMHWVKKSNFEVSGLGKVVLDEEKQTIKVIDAMLLEQTNTSATTDIEAEAICKAMYQLKDSPGELKWWWHSHNTMDVFWSGTDLSTIQELGANGWMAATVFNHKEEVLSAYCQVSPVRLLVPDLTTYVSRPEDEKLIKSWDKEYEKNVTEKKFTSYISNMPGRSFKPYSSYLDNFPGTNTQFPQDHFIGEVESEDDLPPGFFLEGKHYEEHDWDDIEEQAEEAGVDLDDLFTLANSAAIKESKKPRRTGHKPRRKNKK